MTWQPTSAQWPDVELWATGHLRAALAAHLEDEDAAVGDDMAETAAFGPYRRG